MGVLLDRMLPTLGVRSPQWMRSDYPFRPVDYPDRRAARAAASDRVRTPSLASTAESGRCTVRAESTSSAAVSGRALDQEGGCLDCCRPVTGVNVVQGAARLQIAQLELDVMSGQERDQHGPCLHWETLAPGEAALVRQEAERYGLLELVSLAPSPYA